MKQTKRVELLRHVFTVVFTKLLYVRNLTAISPPDLSMMDWICTAPCSMPHTSIIKRIPQRKGAEMKILSLNTALP